MEGQEGADKDRVRRKERKVVGKGLDGGGQESNQKKERRRELVIFKLFFLLNCSILFPD